MSELEDVWHKSEREIAKDLRAENAKLRAAAVNLMAAIDDMHGRGETFTARVSIAAADMQAALKD